MDCLQLTVFKIFAAHSLTSIAPTEFTHFISIRVYLYKIFTKYPMSLEPKNLLVVGAGGIGCELLKNLAICGCKNIFVVSVYFHLDFSNSQMYQVNLLSGGS